LINPEVDNLETLRWAMPLGHRGRPADTERRISLDINPMGLEVRDLGFGFGFGVWGLGSVVCGLEFGAWGLGFGVWGLGLRVWG